MRDSISIGLSCVVFRIALSAFSTGLSESGIKQIASPLRLCREGYLFYEASLSEVPRLLSRIVNERELSKRTYEVGGGDKGAPRQDFLSEPDCETQPYHTVLFRIFGVE